MKLMTEYIKKKWTTAQFENELLRLISKYNKIRKSYLLIYASAPEKPIMEKALNFDDYYLFHDMLKDKSNKTTIDIYIETGGGSGEAAENIVRFLRKNFNQINFVISGQAKSAGTILVLSGDEIYMTETGSLGPIDAQIKIGRSFTSSHDYIEWVDEKRKQAAKSKQLNPFDATMIAQITPGEIKGVYTTHKYAQDLVIEWLIKYKFKNWEKTETRKNPVTPEMKIAQAKKIAYELTNRARWKTHSRSLDIDDLKGLGLRINRIEDDPKLADTVFRIQTVCRFLFDNTNSFKIFATKDSKIFKSATPPAMAQQILQKKVIPGKPEVAELDINCNNCGRATNLYAMFTKNAKKEAELKKKGRIPWPKNDIVKCACGANLALNNFRNDIEKQVGKKIIT